MRRARAVYDNDQALFCKILDALCLGKVGEFATFGALCEDADAVEAVMQTDSAFRLVIDNDAAKSLLIGGQAFNISMASGLRFHELSSCTEFQNAVATTYSDTLQGQPVATVKRVARCAAKNPGAFAGYVGKKLSFAVDGMGDVAFAIADVAKDSNGGVPVGFTLICDVAVTAMAYGIRKTGTESKESSVWSDSLVRAWLRGDFAQKLSPDLLSAIETVDKKTNLNSARTDSTDIEQTRETIWIPSKGELDGTAHLKETSFGAYQLFKNSRENLAKSLDGSQALWWTRTMYSKQQSACAVYETLINRVPDTDTATVAVVPCFCI